VRVGEFEILFFSVDPQARLDPERTVFDLDFVNPFTDDAAVLAATVKSLARSYEREAAARRDEALQLALREALEGAPDEVSAMMGRLCADIGAEVETPPRLRGAAVQPPAERAPAAPVRAPQVSDARASHLMELLLGFATRFVALPRQFQHEFMGTTLFNSVFDEPAALADYLLAPSVSEEEAAERRDQLGAELEKVVLHHIALLDGYRASARLGAERMLDHVDPARAEREVSDKNRLFRYAPPLASGAVLRRLKATCEELRGEEWSVAERKIFRPAFVKAYLARMAASPGRQPRHDSA
jgi:type VI secretion system protein ImpI